MDNSRKQKTYTIPQRNGQADRQQNPTRNPNQRRLGRDEQRRAAQCLTDSSARSWAAAASVSPAPGRGPTHFPRPILAARLGDRSRVAICVPPASSHVAITVRPFGTRSFSAAQLIAHGALPAQHDISYNCTGWCVRGRSATDVEPSAWRASDVPARCSGRMAVAAPSGPVSVRRRDRGGNRIIAIEPRDLAAGNDREPQGNGQVLGPTDSEAYF